MRQRFPAVLVLLALALGGCRGYQWPFGQPRTIQQQRLDASVHDPYTDTQAGPEVVGGRPRDYQNPWPESQRGQTPWTSPTATRP